MVLKNRVQEHKRAKKIIAGCTVLILIGVAFLILNRYTFDEEPTVLRPKNNYSETIHVVADSDYAPYSFIDEDGNYSGHDLDLIYALADIMHKNVEIQMMHWDDAKEKVRKGEADLLLGLEYRVEAAEDYQLSIPLQNSPFVAFGTENFNTIGELYDKKIATLKSSGSYSSFIKPYRLENITTYYETYGEAFDSVVKGENDYVVCRYSVGRRMIANEENTSIDAVGPVLVDNSLCIGVNKDNKQLLNELNDAIIILMKDGTIEDLKQKWLGNYIEVISFGEFVQKNFKELVIAFLILCAALAAFLVARKMKRTRRLTGELKKKAEMDQLTGLYNKITTETLLSQEIESYKNQEVISALLVMDIDNFKSINDNLGHAAGDVTLKGLAKAIKNMFRSDDIVGRIGGDEFLVFMKNIPSGEIAQQKAQEICEKVYQAYKDEKEMGSVSVSIGIAIYPKDGTDHQTLYKNADTALYASKKQGKNKVTMYQQDPAE